MGGPLGAVGENQTQCAVVFGTRRETPRTTGNQIRYNECLGYDLPYFHAHTYSIANRAPPPVREKKAQGKLKLQRGRGTLGNRRGTLRNPAETGKLPAPVPPFRIFSSNREPSQQKLVIMR